MLEAKDGVVELNFGFPNFRPLVVEPNGVSHGVFEFGQANTKSYGQFILKGEFMLADNLGFMASMNYSMFETYEESQQDIFDGVTNQWTTNSYYYKTRVHKFRIAAGINFHLVRTERLDSYIGIMGGTKKAIGSYESNDPNSQGEIDIYMFPIAIRSHFGIRYFLTDYLALNAEVGMGGPLVSFGATYKF